MRLPDLIGVRCLAEGEPFPGAWLALTLEGVNGEGKSALSFVFGPTREDGRLFLPREEVLAQGRYLEQAVGLDYGRIEDRWCGRGWLAVAGAAELRHQFRLTFGQPPLRQATAHRVAAARALRFLSEHEGERFTVVVETELPEEVTLEVTRTSRGDWLPEDLYEPVQELLGGLARRELPQLIDSGRLDAETAEQIEQAIIDYGATPMIPPDIALLLGAATADGEHAWTIEIPLWTREEGPSDLVVWLHARELESGPVLELRGVTLD
jgi:hypothetical protein